MTKDPSFPGTFIGFTVEFPTPTTLSELPFGAREQAIFTPGTLKIDAMPPEPTVFSPKDRAAVLPEMPIIR